jgi:NADH:ubiquinone oxidoreductase subunit 6 (subunit J)
MNRGSAARPMRFVVLIVLAIAVGVAITLAIAGLEHGIEAVHGTLKWFALIAGAYLAGAIAAALVLTLGWRRFIRTRDIASHER